MRLRSENVGYRIETLTADNNTEFDGYQDIERADGMRFVFATPQHSWKRGTNENTNGLIRQYPPKSTGMTGRNQQQCNDIANERTTRPGKHHGCHRPEELFDRIARTLHFKLDAGHSPNSW